MSWIRALVANVRALVRRDGIAHEIRDELHFHLDMRIAEYRARGLTEAEATRLARRRFGNPVVLADQGYDIRGAGIMETVWQDVRYAIRQLRRERGFAVIAILTLALAMGASTALFSVIDAALLRPVPYPDADRIVTINVQQPQANGQVYGLAPSLDDLDHWRASSDVFAALGRGRVKHEPLIVEGTTPQRLPTSLISPGFLEVFGVRPLVGRALTIEDTRPGSPPVAWLGYDYWQREFEGSDEAIGRTLRVDGAVTTIVGVLPAWFYRDSAVWRPMPDDPMEGRAMRGSGTPTYGRLVPAVSLGDAGERLSALTEREPGGEGSTTVQVQLRQLYEATVARYRPAVRALAGAMSLVLLIACLNVGGLLLARGATRRGELATRASLGAGRTRLVRQLLTESLTIAVASGVGAVILAWLMLDGLVAVLPLALPDNAPPAINLTVLGFSVALTFVVTLLCGIAPAIRLSRVHLGPQLSRAGRHHGTPISRRGGQMAIAAQVALALVLLSGTGLMVRSFARALSIEVGFDPSSFLTMEVYPVEAGDGSHATYFPDLLDRARALPGVEAAGATTLIPLSGGGSYTSAVAGTSELHASVKGVTPGFFEAIGLTPVLGRLPTWREQGANPAVLSEAAASRLFPDQNPLGRTFEMSRATHTVFAVVPDIVSRSVLDPDSDRPDVYPMLKSDAEAWSGGFFGRRPIVIVRPSGGVPDMAGALRETALSIGPPVIVDRIRSGSDWFGDNVEQIRNQTILLGLLGGLGLCLALVGVFSVTAYAVSRRTHEVGVRMAFGARPVDAVRHILRDTTWPLVAGIAAGLIVTWYAGRFIESFLYDTPPREPITLAVVAIATALVALIAAWIPARRAAKVDPVVALRAE